MSFTKTVTQNILGMDQSEVQVNGIVFDSYVVLDKYA